MGKGKRRIAAPPAASGHRVGVQHREASDDEQLSPVFCLRHLAKGYSLRECEAKQAARFVKRLHELCQLTWKDIHDAPREGFGTEKMPKDSIRATLPDRVTDDVEHLHVFRFGGIERIIGLKHNRVFEVYLIDPRGKAYEHNS